MFLFTCGESVRRNVSGSGSDRVWAQKKKKIGRPVKNAAESMINERACQPSSPLRPPAPPTSLQANGKYLSGGLPGVYAVLDVGDPGVFLQRVNGFQDVLSPVFHLRRQPNTEITHTPSSAHTHTHTHAAGVSPQASFDSIKAGVAAWLRYLQNEGVVFVGHLQRHGGPHLHDGRQRDAHFGLRGLTCKKAQREGHRY